MGKSQVPVLLLPYTYFYLKVTIAVKMDCYRITF